MMQVLGSPLSSSCCERNMNSCCGSLLSELQQAWDEMGESEAEKDRMLMELEKECLEVYRRKVDEATKAKARLHQSVASTEAELATLRASLGELGLHSPIRAEKRPTLKEQLASIKPLVDNLRNKKEERMRQFADVRTQIEKISGEISGYNNDMSCSNSKEENDLSLRKLNEHQTHLHSLQKEKSDRLNKVLEYVNEVHCLCGVLGLDFGKTVSEVHPSLQQAAPEQSANISNNTLECLAQAIQKLKMERRSRIQKLKEIVVSLFELWNLMDSPEEERSLFRRITFVLKSSESEVTEPGILSQEIIEQATAEVERLTTLKASRMKELVLKRRLELEEVCRKAHMGPDMSTSPEKSIALIDSGLVDPSELLANIEAQITKAKDEAVNRKDIMDRIDRWLAACEEERWLEDYSLDENRYAAGRGAHLNLKRAERARVTINKIPAMVDNLMNKTLAWENEKNMLFLYDEVRLVSILEDYKITKQQKEEEKRRFRNQKKLQDLLLTEKEAIFGSKPSPKRSNSLRNTNGYRMNGDASMPSTPRRFSASSATPESATPRSRSGRQNGHFKEMRRLSTAPLNFVSLTKEDTMSYASVCGSEFGSPPRG
ncbi:hypothetical protein IFM89_003036 [Coptis chinensis]|uniref:65-kDa microtubule-associated protein 6 n=1 Tax=Coptis chinensis TaxID=261450 RepID=A0A835MBF8_9MAGN|nr:hypothetical protein IFM89_003036 [Coptis chinensis]